MNTIADTTNRAPAAAHPTSSFHKAMWCGAVTCVTLFVSFALTLPPGGNYFGMLGALTWTCFAPAAAAGWIAGRGGRTRSWLAVGAMYALCFIGFSLLTAAGRP